MIYKFIMFCFCFVFVFKLGFCIPGTTVAILYLENKPEVTEDLESQIKIKMRETSLLLLLYS